MADGRRLDIEQILQEAQHRWLRPAEIYAILQNHSKFRINTDPPNRPPSGSLFLFDRKVLRYFRKDGHNWRKKNDGKTVKEAHERLKSGSIDVLHCYYAHGQDNENFQRRCYWMLEEDKSNIVFVHYREVKGSRTTFNRTREANGRQVEEDVGNSEVENSAVSIFQQYGHQRASQLTDTSSVNGTHASDYEDAQSAYRHHASPGFQSTHDVQSPVMNNMEAGSVPYYPDPISSGQYSAIPDMSVGSITQGEKGKTPITNDFTYVLHQNLDFPSWEKLVESSNSGHQSVGFLPSLPSTQSSAMNMMPGQGNELLGQVLIGTFGKSHELGSRSNGLEQWQQASDYDLTTEVNDVNISMSLSSAYPTEQIGYNIQNDYQMQASTARGSDLIPESAVNVEDTNYQPHFRQPLLDGVKSDGMRKLDSFDRWMSKELGDVTESNTQLGLGSYWDTVGSEDGVDDSGISTEVPLDNYVLGPSLSQDQFFTIIDFSPIWAYSGSEIKVLIMGKFLRSQNEVEKHNWACMFGELEVPAEILANGVIRCHTPLHEAGRVPFYITCSNRLACSEVREFEFCPFAIKDEDLTDIVCVGCDETLHMRFGKLLTLKPVENVNPENFDQSNASETSRICTKVDALLKDDTEWEQMLNLTKQDDFSADKVKDHLLQKLLKDKLHAWLIQKVNEGGKGASVLDEGGQGVLHFAGALGYDWAIPPTIAAGVSVNFRDANGCTALHWAAYYGRERTVAFLISLDAAPGALTDPTPRYPSRTPAALASSNGHKGIAGYLSEYELTFQLSTLDLKNDSSNDSDTRNKSVETVSERIATPLREGDLPQGLSMKDSLAAVRNATQAAARIHQVFRVQSFQRKQLKEFGDSEFGMSDARALSLIAVKSNKVGKRNEPVHAAAIRIQNKFRSWKGRKDFLLTRQRIIKIQAHVRGHQVRKNYKKIIWSVGILDKVILRWRRKGRGLTGFKPEGSSADTSSSMPDNSNNTKTKEDDYDFLKEGRKQTEERLNKALSRVKSMVQYPEARDQYRRLLNVVSEMQETKALHDKVLNDTEIDFDDDLIDLEALLADDTFMSM